MKYKKTRWSARIDAVKPFAAHLPNLVIALRKLLQGEAATLTPETFADVKNILKFLKTFACLLLSSIWYKVLRAIDFRNKVLQTKKITLDVEQKLMDDLVNELIALRNNFDAMSKKLKPLLQSQESLLFGPKKPKRKRKTFFDEDNNNTWSRLVLVNFSILCYWQRIRWR